MMINRLIAKVLFLVMLSASGVHAIELAQNENSEARTLIADDHLKSVFGGWLFTGGFKQAAFTGINPNYRIAQGDTLLVQLWGGINVQQEVVVDAQGNVFIPKVGPVKVLGVENRSLNDVVLKSIKRVYKSNVEAYVTLTSSQTVKVFLSGLVNKPGLYEGQSADSVLRFIDQAGGIRRDLGSYRNIEVKRHNTTRYSIDLYAFIEQGKMPDIQLQDGDVIFVGRKSGEISIEGEVGFTGRYELKGNYGVLSDIINAVVEREKATHVTLVEHQGTEVTARQFGIGEIADVQVRPGALIKVSSQLRPTSISVEIVGEHNSQIEMVMPWGASLKDLLDRVEYTELSNRTAVQLYRKSVAERQKEMLMASLGALEQSVLTARSSTRETAELRKAEAETILKWIERAKSVEPRGQVLLTDGFKPEDVLLQQGDKIVIPARRNLVMIHGEVLFPTAITYQKGQSTRDYIRQAGGTNRDLGNMNVLVMKPNGSFVSVNRNLTDRKIIGPGDEVFVLAKPELKALQLTKDLTQVIYQVAVSAAVVLAL